MAASSGNPCGTRPDFCVLCADASGQLKDEIQSLVEELEKRGLIGRYMSRDCLPGNNRLEWTNQAVFNCNYVIFAISSDLTADQAKELSSSMKQARRVKMEQTNSIIALFIGMSRHEVDKQLDSPLFSSINIEEPLLTTDEKWINRLEQALKQAILDDLLRSHLDGVLPHACCPWLRTSVDQTDSNLFTNFIQPSLKIERLNVTSSTSSDKDAVGDKDGNVHDINMNDLINKCVPGAKLMVVGQGGIGKSTLLSEIALRWQKQFHGPLSKFKQLYLIPLREVNNHTELMERIICNDLQILSPNLETDVRRSLKFASSSAIFLIDGYDELRGRNRRKTTINSLLAGEVSPNSCVVVTTRTYAEEHIEKQFRHNYWRVQAGGFTSDNLLEHTNIIFPDEDPKQLLQVLTQDIPRDVIHIPLFFNLVCYIEKERRKRISPGHTLSRQFHTACSVLDAAWGIMLGINEEKEGIQDNVVFYKSFWDRNIDTNTTRLLKDLSKMCFECVTSDGNKDELMYEFTNETLSSHGLCMEELGRLGLLQKKKTGKSGKVFMSFVHTLFQEHMAAYHMTQHPEDLKRVLARLDGFDKDTEKALGPYANSIVFAVAMKPDILKEVASKIHCITLTAASHHAKRLPNYMNLSYVARLLHECATKEAGDHLINALLQAKIPLNSPCGYPCRVPDMHPVSYGTLLCKLGSRGCLSLLHRMYHYMFSVKGNRGTICNFGKCTTLVLVDPIVVACLPVMIITAIERLLITPTGHLDVLQHTIHWTDEPPDGSSDSQTDNDAHSGRSEKVGARKLNLIELRGANCTVSSVYLVLKAVQPPQECSLKMYCCTVHHDQTNRDPAVQLPLIRLGRLTFSHGSVPVEIISHIVVPTVRLERCVLTREDLTMMPNSQEKLTDFDISLHDVVCSVHGVYQMLQTKHIKSGCGRLEIKFAAPNKSNVNTALLPAITLSCIELFKVTVALDACIQLFNLISPSHLKVVDCNITVDPDMPSVFQPDANKQQTNAVLKTLELRGVRTTTSAIVALLQTLNPTSSCHMGLCKCNFRDELMNTAVSTPEVSSLHIMGQSSMQVLGFLQVENLILEDMDLASLAKTNQMILPPNLSKLEMIDVTNFPSSCNSPFKHVQHVTVKTKYQISSEVTDDEQLKKTFPDATIERVDTSADSRRH